MTLLVGRGLCGPLVPIEISPGAGALTLTGYAPSISIISVGTLLLSHFNGTDGETTFTDEVVGVAWTRSGSAEIDTAIKKFGEASLRLPGGSGAQDVHTNSISGFDSQGSSWTIEGWFYTVGGHDGQIMNDTSGGQFQALIQPGTATLSLDGTAESATIANETWYHWAIVHDAINSTGSFYFDGNRIVHRSAYSPGDFSTFYLRAVSFSTDNHWDEVRLTKAVQYSGTTYTIPTSEFS